VVTVNFYAYTPDSNTNGCGCDMTPSAGTEIFE